ncbi:LysE family transporter [Paenibacillus germinis]|uniref:LysE family transporter n=1 Tax=Paenibacillus germinis TaxID=2654979 RepID=UPI001FE53313|nr:LysE family transporter [Paenibacillus germinis]
MYTKNDHISQSGIASAVALVFGVFVGSALWWFALSTVIGMLRDRIHVTAFRWINRISGVILTVFVLVAIIGLLLGE